MKFISLIVGTIISVSLVSYFILNKKQHPYHQLGEKMCSCVSILEPLKVDYPINQEVQDSIIKANPKIQSEYRKCLMEFYNLGIELQLDSSRYYGVENRVISKEEMKYNYIKGFEKNGCNIDKTVFELE